jgi:hypothetical protein
VNNQKFIVWWGAEWNSVYPVAATAHFSFTADNVDLGTVDANVTTFWNTNVLPEPAYILNGAYYTTYATQVTGPVPVVPEPSTFLLLGFGLAGFGFWRRFNKSSFAATRV